MRGRKGRQALDERIAAPSLLAEGKTRARQHACRAGVTVKPGPCFASCDDDLALARRWPRPFRSGCRTCDRLADRRWNDAPPASIDRLGPRRQTLQQARQRMVDAHMPAEG